MRRLTRPLLVLLAVVFLIEAWLWSHLEPIVGQIVARIPLRAVKAWVAGTVRKLPPAASLVIFIAPVAMLFPVKLVGLWLLAHKHWIAASALLVFAKLVGLAVTAFVFEVTRPKLLQMMWFRRLYRWVLTALDWAHTMVRPLELRIKRLLRLCRPKRARRALRLFWRVRRRMHGSARPELSASAMRAARTAPAP
jgi:hypothetical protein